MTFRTYKDRTLVQMKIHANELCSALASASRYVEAHAENADNHPQSRDIARSLLAEIKTKMEGPQ